jgi:hypothetical protein
MATHFLFSCRVIESKELLSLYFIHLSIDEEVWVIYMLFTIIDIFE